MSDDFSSQSAAFRYSSAPARRDALLSYIDEQGYCTTTELSRGLRVSEMTIRRDIAKLEGVGKLRSVPGGVTQLPAALLAGSDFGLRASAKRTEKAALASKALEFIDPGGIIAIDAGTTTAEIGRILPPEYSLSVITNSLPVLNYLAALSNVETTSLGGTFHKDSQSYSGPVTSRQIADLNVGTLFLGASGITERGVFCANAFDAVTKRAYIEAAEQVILVADSSKFSAAAMVRVCALSDIDRIIVDGNVGKEDLRMLEDHGVQISLVERDDPASIGNRQRLER